MDRTYLRTPSICFGFNNRNYDAEKIMLVEVALVEKGELLCEGQQPALRRTKKFIVKESTEVIKKLDHSISTDTLKDKVSINQIDSIIRTFKKKRGYIPAHCFVIIYCICDIIVRYDPKHDFAQLSDFSKKLFDIVECYYNDNTGDEIAYYCIQSYDALQKKL